MHEKIVDLKHIKGYILEVEFETGEKGLVDLSEYAKRGGVFARFADIKYFERVSIDPEWGVLVWPGDVDIAPETVYRLATGKSCDNRVFLRERFSILKIGLFGSFARNEQTESSDIDLLIEIEDNTPDIHELKEELRTFVGSRFHRNVDIAREKYLKPYAREIILSEVKYVE